MKADLNISSKLSEAISFLRDCEKEHKYYYDRVGEQEKRQTDLLHALELDTSDYASRCKTATQLRHCLLERRYYKDRAEERAPVAEFLSDLQNKNLLDSLGRVLGEVRKMERYHKNRIYTPRSPTYPDSEHREHTYKNNNQEEKTN